MATFFPFIAFYLLMHFTMCQYQTYYVSTNGIDTIVCGMTLNEPCGTLYKASQLIHDAANNSLSPSFSIHILDGQNEREIDKYHTSNGLSSNGYDPCLPMPFNATLQIVITFNALTIHDLNDWYPRNVCEYHLDEQYSNQYMFDGGKSLQINHLIINDYGTHHFYPFIRSIGDHNASITCTDCRFESIVSTVNHSNGSIALLHTLSSIHIMNSSFININVSFPSSNDAPPLISGDHYYSSIDSTRSFLFIDTVFINVSSAESVVTTAISGIRYADRPTRITIQNCTFRNLCVEKSIIYDFTKLIEINVNDTRMDHIACGSIYYSANSLASKILRMDTISVTSISQLNTVAENPLFHFHGTDVKVMMNAVHIHYTYNADQSCSFDRTIFNSVLNLSCDVMQCINPVTAIELIGEMQLSNVHIDIDVAANYSYNDNNCKTFQYDADGTGHFIINEGHMDIRNLSIGRTLCDTFLYNSNFLSVLNVSFTTLQADHYNPNELHSRIIIQSVGTFNALTVHHSQFIGSFKQVYMAGGTGKIYDSTFEYSGHPFQTNACRYFTVVRCNIHHHGRFNRYVKDDRYWKDTITAPAKIWAGDAVAIINSTFVGFSPKALLFFAYTANITISGNVFNVDTTGFFDGYHVPPKYRVFARNKAPLYFKYCSNIRVIHNVFDKNEVDPENEWVRFWRNTGVNCLSNNTFTNTAITTSRSNLTSCFRPQLIHGVYSGFIDESLFGQMNRFVIDRQVNIPFLFRFHAGKVALDQINITFINNDGDPNATGGVPVLMSDAELLIVDSFVSDDILYKANNSLCSVVHNDRLMDHIEAVSRLHIRCGDDDSYYGMSYAWNKSMDSNRTQLVRHLHATKINFTAKSLSYYPGQLLQFQYTITDILHNSIDYSLLDHELMIRLHNNAFFSDFNAKHSDTAGIILTDVSLNDNIGDEYGISIEVLNHFFVATYPIIRLRITGCPMGFGPDNNNFTCIACNTDNYNLVSGNVKQCMSCDPESNAGVKCMDGTVWVAENHWVGFNENNEIISSICPPSLCCINKNKCNYANKNELCAPNRDSNSILCTKCREGYSESMSSTDCVKCTTSYNFEYLLLIFSVSLLGSLLVLRTDKLRNRLENPNPLEQRGAYMKLMLKIMIFKCFLYYEQAISEIVHKATPLNVIPSLVNLSVLTQFIPNTDMCFVNGLNAKQKILMDLMIPVMMVILITSYYFVYVFNKRSAIIIRGRHVNFGKTFLTLFTLTVGKVLDVLCELLSCKTVGNRSVHFYFADEECFGATWFVSLAWLMIVICGFSALFIQVRCMSPAERQNPKYVLFVYTSRYKPQYYYWEFVIFVRRILVALFAAYGHTVVLKLSFVVVIACCAIVQHFYSPFMIHEANNMELVLLQCLLFVTLIQFPYAFPLNETLITVVLCVLIIIPVPLMAYYICKVMRRKTWKQLKEEISNDAATGDSDDDEDDVVAGSALHGHRNLVRIRSNSVEMNARNETVTALCTDCQTVKQCKIYPNDGSFYCVDCWKTYEDCGEFKI